MDKTPVPGSKESSFSKKSSLTTDLIVAVAALALFYGFLSLARYWTAPVHPQAQIDLSPAGLPMYALFSVARIAVAYALSLAVSLIYGYIAARNTTAERFMIPLLDTLQSIPVLSFLPGVMLSMIALFPTSQFGLELGSILLLFTGQVWNMAFSVYSSLKTIPRELLEAAKLYRLSWWQRFIQLELPHTAIGLIWNSMMSVAGAWFSLMVCEMFVLGNRDLRLPGLGSYLQSASNAGATGAILSGLIVMIAVIVIIDQLVWRPVIAWSAKFKFEQVEGSQTPESPVLNSLRRSRLLHRLERASLAPALEVLTMYFARADSESGAVSEKRPLVRWGTRILLAGCAVAIVYAAGRMIAMLAAISLSDVR